MTICVRKLQIMGNWAFTW